MEGHTEPSALFELCLRSRRSHPARSSRGHRSCPSSVRSGALFGQIDRANRWQELLPELAHDELLDLGLLAAPEPIALPARLLLRLDLTHARLEQRRRDRPAVGAQPEVQSAAPSRLPRTVRARGPLRVWSAARYNGRAGKRRPQDTP